MPPSDIAIRAVATVTAFSFLMLIASVAIALGRIVRRRPVGRLVVRSIAAFAAVVVGYAVLATTRWPWIALLLVGAGLVLAGVLLANRRPLSAGTALVGLAAPSTVYWGSFLVDNAVAGRHWVMLDVGPPFVIGLGGVLLGLTVAVADGRSEATRHPDAAKQELPRYGALPRALYRPIVLGLPLPEAGWAFAMILTGLGSTALIHGRSFGEGFAIVAVATVAAALAGALLWMVAWPARDRHAYEAFSWIGEWELDRWVALSGGPAAPSKADFRRWMRVTPDAPENRWIRYEVLAMDDRLDEARATAAGIPDDTSIGRLDRAAALAFVDWLQGGVADLSPLRAAADAIEPADGDARLRADLVVAASEARNLLGAGDPAALEPLVAMRRRLGPRADRQLWVVIRRRIWPRLLRAAFVVVPGMAIVDRLIGVA